MKKFIKVLLGIVLIVTLTTIIGYNIIMSGKEVLYVQDTVSLQSGYESYFSCYGYTMDNPNIVVNPYKISPLTALVMFETSDVDDVVVTIYNKDGNVDFTYKVKGSKNNYVPIYGLYSDYNNRIDIKLGNKIKKINIETDSINEVELIDNYQNNDFSFVDMGNYSYAVDNNGDVRWYLDGFGGNLNRLSNGNFLLHTDRNYGNGYYTGLVEIDMLGKIYYEYSIDNGGCNGYYDEFENNFYIVSDGYINVFNRQSGEVIDSYSIDRDYNYIKYNDGSIICSDGVNSIKIDIVNNNVLNLDDVYVNNNVYLLDQSEWLNYSMITAIRIGGNRETTTVNNRVWLLNYNDLDDDRYNIDIYKEFDRLVIKGSIDTNSDVYVILDGISGKRVYEMDYDDNGYYKYISNMNLSGKYNIYLKINGVLYKTGYYVDF